MEYDPIKDRLGALVGAVPWRRRLFYRVLDLFFLRAWYVHRSLGSILQNLLEQSDERPLRVLDAGTGFGQYTYFLLENFPEVEVTAVDLKTDYLDICRLFSERAGLGDRVEWVYADLTDAEAYPFNHQELFDVILSVDVMEHIEEDRAALQNMARVLRPGGYLLINTPSDEGGSGVTDGGQESFISEHAREGYGIEELERKMEDAGLEPVQTIYAYGPYGSLAWRLLIQGPMKLLSVSWAAIGLLPLYYLPVFPVGMLLNAIDLRRENRTGTGLTVVARRGFGDD
jgi:SAM-dependent methyltransferase